MNLANLITLARLLSVPAVVALILHDALLAAFWLFLAAGASDAVDGIVAKRFGQASVVGSYLDPIADKALLVSTYVALSVGGHLAIWLTVLVVFRDVLIIGGAILFHTLTGRLEMRPLMVSKINTTLQIVLAVAALGAVAYELDVPLAIDGLSYVVAFTTLASGGAYLYLWALKAHEIDNIEDVRHDDRGDGR